MKFILAALLALGVASASVAQTASPLPGTLTVTSAKPFAVFLDALLDSIGANKMGLVAHACADCGAKAIGVKIPGNRVVMAFHPRYAVRMLKANVAAGIEAPIRLYVTERADGSATLTYRTPSAVFAPYKTPDLDVMARELDGVFKKIVADALR
ncbi:MAG: DUF302 domain-containing protein [Rhodospirillaceae bacterium]|nr:DUF302 domain-containing protein [Rhodospirillaceae bacterium]MBT5667600.1 DUF302 domain-containing protein [Rhodospirillaceae bacterium]